MAEGSYGKRPLWQWILIYLVVGAIVYAAIYYFVFAKKGGGYDNSAPAQQNVPSQQTAPQSGSESGY